jgi:hypothetical protein
MQYDSRSRTPTYQPPTRAQTNTAAPMPKSLDGLWVLLAANDGQLQAEDADGKVPVLAQAGDQYYYLLAFRNAAKARTFQTTQGLEDVTPRMVVGAYKEELIRVARAVGAIGMLVDYEPGGDAPVAAAPLS